MIRSGRLALLSFPQTDQAVGRLRPTLVLRRLPGPYDDWLTAEIPKLSPSLAAAYATKHAKTVSCDVNSLIHRGLIEKRGARVRARREIILAFLPPRKQRS